MIRFVNIYTNGLHYDGYILIESFEDLETYNEFRKKQASNAMDNLSHRSTTQKSKLAGYAEMFTIPQHFIIQTIGNVYRDQLKRVLNGHKLGINLNGGYFPIPKDALIEDIIQTENKIFKPKTLHYE